MTKQELAAKLLSLRSNVPTMPSPVPKQTEVMPLSS